MRFTSVLVFLLLSFVMSALADGLRPEEGVFAGHDPPSAYDILLRQALLRDDGYRLCQMVYQQSFAETGAVYITQELDTYGLPASETFVVISRTLKKQLWKRLINEMERVNPLRTNSSWDWIYQPATLRKIRAAVDTRTAILDTDAATNVGEACRDVLLQVSYQNYGPDGLDGTTTMPATDLGHFLQWNLSPGRRSRRFVAME
jgi:hypothetical protein